MARSVLIRGRWKRTASAHLRLYTVAKYMEVPQIYQELQVYLQVLSLGD